MATQVKYGRSVTASMCEVTLIGLVGNVYVNDYEVNGEKRKVTTFSVAVNNPRNEVTWVTCKAFNGLGGMLAEHLKKGRLVYVKGSLQTGAYPKEIIKQTKDGKKVKLTVDYPSFDVIVSQFLFLDVPARETDQEEELVSDMEDIEELF